MADNSIVNDLAKALRGGRIPITINTYFVYIAATAITSLLAWIGMVIILDSMRIGISIAGTIPDSTSRLILLFLFIAVGCIGAYLYPFLIASGRKNRIDADLPYAITYMQALSTTMTLYETIRQVALAKDLFGEMSHECGMIVRDIEVFGDDLTTAMRNVHTTTPSPSFSDFLNDLILLSESGGSITQFFAARARYYREVAEQDMQKNMKTTEIIAEVYVTAFVAGPIIAMIMIVAQQLSGNQSADMMPMIMIGVPVGSLAMIAILYILFPAEGMEIQQGKVEEQEFFVGPRLIHETDESRTYQKKIRSHRSLQAMLLKMKNPFKLYISDYTWGIIFGAIAACAVGYLINDGYFNELAPGYGFQTGICALVIAGVLPLAVAYEGRALYIRRLERQIPEFLRMLADMKDIGMTIQNAIARISRSQIGVLSTELRVVSEELQSGAVLSSSLERMEERIGVLSVKRAISLVIKASEVTDRIQEVMMIAISDFEYYLKLKQERFTSAFTYVAIVYLSFGVFLYTAYQLNISFLESFSELATIDSSGNIIDMFWVAILLGGFSGIMAGQLSVNNPFAGLKHTIIFLLLTVIVFVVVIGGVAL
ncbi:MAG: type II secretion system F family protein [Methanocalculus sp.]|uniref:type II secretion system F family protein n=1 Tax=Methanocalculus sp. TaxID=2004547 RepID=UPI00271F1350|nr:type II secretion system F family protein [Methanocalculus sp.]MDO9540228.1 type II secretion system F family protein [Methanocalculus sp.]